MRKERGHGDDGRVKFCGMKNGIMDMLPGSIRVSVCVWRAGELRQRS